MPITEAHPLQAQSPYSASKIAADQIALSFHASFGTPVSVVRPFNTYGPRQSARAIIPTVISQINAGLTEIRLGSLHPTRDFSFISDTVAGFIAVAESERTLGEVVNLGSGFEVSIGDTVKMIADIMGKDINLVEDQQRIRPEASEVERLWADTSKVKSLTDWQPAYEGLDGLRRGPAKTIDWFSDPENASGYKAEIYNI